MQVELFEGHAPPPPPLELELRLCSCEQLLSDLSEAPSLIVADPPWVYHQAPGHSANPENHYQPMTDLEIAQILARAYGTLERGRLALWLTWPKLEDWRNARAQVEWPWRYVSGGSWHKHSGRPGTGYHWLGSSELVELYVKGTGLCTRWGPLTNAHESQRTAHSEKPVEWMIGWLERWTEPGDLVVELFAGLAPVARACASTGRRYLGAEIDPERHAQALLSLHRWRVAHDLCYNRDAANEPPKESRCE